MRDAAGEASDRFHLLRLPQSLFRQFAARDFLLELSVGDGRALRPPQCDQAQCEHGERRRHAKNQMLGQIAQPAVDDGPVVETRRRRRRRNSAGADRHMFWGGHPMDETPTAKPDFGLGANLRHERTVRVEFETGARRFGIAREYLSILAHQRVDARLWELGVIIGEIFRRDGNHGHAGERAIARLARRG